MPDSVVIDLSTGEETITDVPEEELFPDGARDDGQYELSEAVIEQIMTAIEIHPILRVNRAEMETWIDNNVTDLDSVKVALKEFGSGIILLRKIVRLLATDDEVA